jgi:hypothetical protein
MGRNGGTIGAASRIPGIDLARFLAIAGMLAVHVGPMGLTDPMGRLYALLTHGRASILFGLLAGIGVSLLAQSRSASLGETRLRLVWQAALLLPLGLWLQTLDVPIRVILRAALPAGCRLHRACDAAARHARGGGPGARARRLSARTQGRPRHLRSGASGMG